jgi:hypothetical protein
MEKTMSLSPTQISRATMKAYVDKDRSAVEALIAPDFHFTSPMDNRLSRDAYFELCWPNSETMAKAEIVHAVDDGDRAWIVYEVTTTTGKQFRNAELHTTRNGELVDVEVYFGWEVPHGIPLGQHSENEGVSHP